MDQKRFMARGYNRLVRRGGGYKIYGVVLRYLGKYCRFRYLYGYKH